jgi:hypothetical protein
VKVVPDRHYGPASGLSGKPADAEPTSAYGRKTPAFSNEPTRGLFHGASLAAARLWLSSRSPEASVDSLAWGFSAHDKRLSAP